MHLDPAVQPRVRGELAHAAPRLPPQLSRDGEAQVGDVAQGVDEEVDPLVVPHDAEGQEAGRAVVLRPGLGWAAGQVRGQVELAHVVRAERDGERGLVRGVDDDGIHPTQEGLHELAVTGVALVREDVVGDEDGPGTAAGRRGAAHAGRSQQREVGRGDRRDDVDDDDDVDVAQPAAGAHPGVRPGPREHPQGAGERLDVGGSPRDGLLTGVERRGVEVAPRDERDVVAGIRQLVGERGGVGGDASLERVGRADERDLERGAVRHRLSTSRRGRRAAPGWRS